MGKIEKVLKALNEQGDQFCRMAKDEALQALIGPTASEDMHKSTARNWYTKHLTIEEAIKTIKYNYK